VDVTGAQRAVDDDRGVAIVWALTLMSLLLLVGLLAGAVGQQAVVRQRLASAADVAALAAAQALVDPCGAAERSAAANGARLLDCTMAGQDYLVSVSGPAPNLVRRLFALLGRSSTEVTATARAGPPPSV